MADGEYLTEGDAPSLDSVQGVRLLALLQDLVRERGRTQAADDLGVNYKTVVGIIESGRLTRRVAQALERMLLAQNVESLLEDREVMKSLAQRVSALEERDGHLDDRLREAVEREWQRRSDGPAGAFDPGEAQLTGEKQQARGPAGEPGMSLRLPYPRLLHPTVVSLEAEAGEEELYGVAATELVVRWRQARWEFLAASGRLERAVAEERMRGLEVRLIGEHGMTLPPAVETWDSPTRRSELWVRERALRRVRWERVRAQWRRRLGKLLTLGWKPGKPLRRLRRARASVKKVIRGRRPKSSCRRRKPT